MMGFKMQPSVIEPGLLSRSLVRPMPATYSVASFPRTSAVFTLLQLLTLSYAHMPSL